ELEKRALALMESVESLGGAAKAIASGFVQEEIARSAYAFQLRVEGGDTVVVGVNRFEDGQGPPIIPSPDFTRLEREQVQRLRATRASRDGDAVAGALAAMRQAAPGYRDGGGESLTPLMPLIIDAVRARASVGEISDTLQDVWGAYRPT
ncbi:MAG: methylmalonyl-CoA mutase family protein, partial [Gemmatimonadaceae bacterium]